MRVGRWRSPLVLGALSRILPVIGSDTGDEYGENAFLGRCSPLFLDSVAAGRRRSLYIRRPRDATVLLNSSISCAPRCAVGTGRGRVFAAHFPLTCCCQRTGEHQLAANPPGGFDRPARRRCTIAISVRTEILGGGYLGKNEASRSLFLSGSSGRISFFGGGSFVD